MSDLEKDKDIREISLVDSDQGSSELVQDGEAVIQNVNQDILKESTNKQSEDVPDGTETAVIKSSTEAPENLQTKEIEGTEGSGSLIPHESVQAPADDLPRNNEEKENVTSAAASQPSKRRRRRTTGGISINSETAGVAEDDGPRRSTRIREKKEAEEAVSDILSDPYFFRKRPLYMEMRRDDYVYLGEDSAFEDSDASDSDLL